MFNDLLMVYKYLNEIVRLIATVGGRGGFGLMLGVPAAALECWELLPVSQGITGLGLGSRNSSRRVSRCGVSCNLRNHKTVQFQVGKALSA